IWLDIVVILIVANIGKQLHKEDRDDRLAGARIPLDDKRGASAWLLKVCEQALNDVFDRDGLVIRERFERRQLEQVGVLDLWDAAAEQTFGTQRLEHVAKRLAVEVASVVAGVA